MLYQRYFLRINQTNMTHLLGLLLAVALGLLGVKARTLLLTQDLPETDVALGTDLPPIYRCVNPVSYLYSLDFVRLAPCRAAASRALGKVKGYLH